MRTLIPGLAVLLACSCGGSPTSPSLADRVSGVWLGHSTLSSASGGECVGATLQSKVGGRDVFAAPIRQTGNDLLAAIAYQGNGTTCELGGNVDGTSVDLTMTSCRVGRLSGVACSDGSVRDLQMLTDRINASVRSESGSGTETTTWNVMLPASSVSVGVLTVTASFIWNRQGLPATDFHVFDGSILPGYVDGVVTIPAENAPFCTECGWF